MKKHSLKNQIRTAAAGVFALAGLVWLACTAMGALLCAAGVG